MKYNFLFANKAIDLADYDNMLFKLVHQDMQRFLKIPVKKIGELKRFKGPAFLEPAVLESYKNWDNPWAICNANLTKGMKVLDCGAGRGILQFYLSSLGMDVYSIDISHNRSKFFKKLKRALNKIGINYTIKSDIVHKKLNKKYKTNVKFKLESATDLSFPDNFFDRVFCISVIEHMDDPIIEKSIKEMERVLKPDGLLLLTFDFHPEYDNNIIGFTGEDFINKVVKKGRLKIANNQPVFKMKDWKLYLNKINTALQAKNPNTSYGVVLIKE